MATKKISYFELLCSDENKNPVEAEILYDAIKRTFQDIEELNVTPDAKQDRLVFYLPKEENKVESHLFIVLGKERAKNGIFKKDYATSEVESAVDFNEVNKGLEGRSYIYIDTENDIVSYINSAEAPSITKFRELVNKVCPSIYIDFRPVPNDEAYRRIIQSATATLSKVSVKSLISIKQPNPELWKYFGIEDSNKLLASLDNQDFELGVSLKVPPRSKANLITGSRVGNLINEILSSPLNPNAKVTISDGINPSQDFDLFSAYFKQEVKIELSKTVSGTTIYFGIEEQIKEYYRVMHETYRISKTRILLKLNKA